MSQDLKPCPFCGCDRIYERGFRCFECPDCGAEGPTKGTRAEAVNAWNTRAEGAPAAEIANAYYEGAMAALGCDWWEDGADFFALVGQDYAAGKPLPATMPKRREGAPAAAPRPPEPVAISREELSAILDEKVFVRSLSPAELDPGYTEGYGVFGLDQAADAILSKLSGYPLVEGGYSPDLDDINGRLA